MGFGFTGGGGGCRRCMLTSIGGLFMAVELPVFDDDEAGITGAVLRGLGCGELFWVF